MVCPKCGWSESNHIEAKKTDEEFFFGMVDTYYW